MSNRINDCTIRYALIYRITNQINIKSNSVDYYLMNRNRNLVIKINQTKKKN